MTLIELALILVYLCILLIKSCLISSDVCARFGFGDTAEGENVAHNPQNLRLCLFLRESVVFLFQSTGLYVFFIFFGLSTILLQIVMAASKLYVCLQHSNKLQLPQIM